MYEKNPENIVSKRNGQTNDLWNHYKDGKLNIKEILRNESFMLQIEHNSYDTSSEFKYEINLISGVRIYRKKYSQLSRSLVPSE